MKKIKELILASFIIWGPIVGSMIAEELGKHIWIDFNWLGMVLPIPVAILWLAMPFIFKD